MLKVGDAVKWTSQAGGRLTTKFGTVAEIVDVGNQPNKVMFPALYKSGIGISRKETSYVILVKNKPYWPHTNKLIPVGGEPGTVYRIINKKTNEMSAFELSESVGAYMLGRPIHEYMIIKSDQRGDRIINIDWRRSSDINVIIADCARG